MKTVSLTAIATVAVLFAGSASAEFKVAEFTYGQTGSFKTTIAQSIKKSAVDFSSSSIVPDQKQVILTNKELDDLFTNLGQTK